MRFLMLNWRDPFNPEAGGAERASLGYMAALVARGHEVAWFANSFPGSAPTDFTDGIHIARGEGKGPSIGHARRWYRAQKPFDLVIDQHHGVPWFAPWWARTRCIAYIHEVLGPIWSSFYRWPLSMIGRWQEHLTHLLYRNIPFWTVSNSTREDLLRHGVRWVKVIPNGIGTQPLPQLEPKPLIPPLRLIVVSRMAPNKRIEHALHAVRILLDRNIPATLALVGEGGAKPDLLRLTDSLRLGDKVTFAGHLPEGEKDALLERSHLLLHASVREGWGLNVIEANALGTPAIVYPVAGLVDSTLHNKTGLICAAETPEAMADAIQTLTGSPLHYNQLRFHAWERAKTFQWTAVLPAACDWLETCARGQAVPP